MIHPSIDKVLTVVDSKYVLVYVVAERTKQMLKYKHFQMDEENYVNEKPAGRALEELDKGLIKVEVNK